MTIAYFYLASGKIYRALNTKKILDEYHILDGRKNDAALKAYCKEFATMFNRYIFGTDIIIRAQILKGKNLTECRSKMRIVPIFDIFDEAKK